MGYTSLLFTYLLTYCEAGLSAGMQREHVPPQKGKKAWEHAAVGGIPASAYAVFCAST